MTNWVGVFAQACGDIGGKLVSLLGIRSDARAVPIGRVARGWAAAVALMMALVQATPGWAIATPEISVTVGGQTMTSGGTYTFPTNPTSGVATSVPIVINNTGAGPLTLVPGKPLINYAAGFTNISSFSFTNYSTYTVAGGGSATTTLSLTPASDGAFAMQLIILSDDADEASFVVHIAGTADAAVPKMEVEIDGQAVVAGGSEVMTGAASGIETTTVVTVRNTGNADLVLTGTLATIGTATNVSGARSTHLSSSTVAPGGTVTGYLYFTPAAAGSFSQSYYWLSNDPTSPNYTVSLTGNAAIGPQLEVRYNGRAVADGSSVNVGDLPVGVTTDVTFTFANTGLLPLKPNYYYADNPTNATFSARQSEHLRYVYVAVPSLAAGATYDVTVPITPTVSGAAGFDLQFYSENGAPREANIRVTANGVVPPEIRVVDRGTGSEITNGNGSTTGTFEAGVSANVIFDIHNDGGSDLNITALPAISAPYNVALGELTVGPNYTGAFEIPATTRTGVVQAVTPVEPGFFSFNVSIPNDDADENPYTITMVGIVQDTTAPEVTATSQVLDPDPGVRTRVAEPANMFTATDTVGVLFKWAEIGGTVYGGPDRTGFPGPATYEFPEGQTTVTAFARDASGNETSRTFSVTVSDTTPPTAPVLSIGFGSYGELNGEVRGELGTTVTLSFPDGTSQTGVLGDFGDGTGYRSIGTASGMPSGAVTAYLTDAFGNTSGTTTFNYVDTTAPDDPTNLFVDLWADGTLRVTGKCEPNSLVSVYWSGTRTVDTVRLASDSVDFALRTSGSRPSGEVFVTCTDPSGNTTNRVSAGSFSDTTPPDTPTSASVGSVLEGAIVISGTVEPGAAVYVTFPDGLSTTVFADGSGNYRAISFPGQPNGPFSVEVADSSGNRSGVYTGTYTDETNPEDPRRIKPPSPDRNGALSFIVSVEFGAFFTVTWPDGSTETKQNTDPELKALEFTSPGGQPSGDIRGQVTDRNGNRSTVVTLATYRDTTPPAPPSGTTVTGHDDGSITVSGMAEPNSTVTVTFPDGSTVTVKTGTDGTFQVTSEPGQTSGSVSVAVTDSQGNPAPSDVSEDYVDDTPPAAPTINEITVGDDGAVQVSGTAEPGSLVTVTFPDGSTGQATADDKGNFVITSSASMTSGNVVVQTQDQADNTSGSSTQYVFTDTESPDVVLSGAPDGFSAIASFTVDVNFNEDVTGFAATDVVVTNATVDSFSGSGASYQVGITTTGAGDVTISVPAEVAQDGSGNLNNASNILSLVNATVEDTEEAIAQFLQTRARQLLAHQPGVVGFLRGGPAGGSLSVTRQASGTNLSFDSRMDGDVWSKLTASVTETDTSRSDYVFGVVGSHRKINEDLLIGAMLQFDHVSQVDGALTTSGTGWLVGPYFAMKVKDQPLYVDGRLLAGKSNNTVSPFGTYEDEFETSRLLAQVNVTGELHHEQITWLPVLGVSYLKDSQQAYVDGLGNSIAASTLEMTEISLGLHFEKALPRARGSLELTGGFDLRKASTRNSGSVSSDSDSLRGRIDLGLAQRNGRGGSFDISGFIDGLGRSSQTLGLEIGVGLQF